MAKQALEKTIEEIKKRLQANSTAYRNLVADKKVHSISIDSEKIKDQITEEMLSRGGYRKDQLPKSLVDIIDTEVPKMCRGMYEDFSNFNTDLKKSEVKDLQGNPLKFTFILASKNSDSPVNIFNAFRLIKQANQKELLRKLRAQVKTLNRSRSENNKIRRISKNFLDIGHQEGSAVSEQRKQEVEKGLFEFASAHRGNAVVNNFLKDLEDITNFNITKREQSESVDIISVELESKFLNRQKGGAVEKAIGIELTEDIKKIAEAMGAQAWVGQEGSDSKLKKIEKRIKNPLAKVAKRNKNIKANFKEESIKGKRSKAEGKKKRTKASASTFKDRSRVSVGVFETRTQNLYPLIALLNQKLSAVVEKNMGDPRLNNQTGRFASSVKITDVVITPKGFPSIGYTYQKNPYQTFERGYTQGSEDRDPRNLIDASIREIAAQMAIGRFYTRRV